MGNNIFWIIATYVGGRNTVFFTIVSEVLFRYNLMAAATKFLPAAPGMNDPALYLAAVDFSEKRIELWEQQVTPSRASVSRACVCVCGGGVQVNDV